MPTSVRNIVEALSRRTATPFAVRMPDGTRHASNGADADFEIVFKSDSAVYQTLARAHMGLLDAYFDEAIDVEGDLNKALAIGLYSDLDGGTNIFNRFENNLHEFRYSNKAWDVAKSNARAHYGLGHDFYKLWLDDPYMMYTCAYWKPGTRTLEEAQQNKIDDVIRKTRLAKGETYVDIGCGFGGFMMRAHETVGATGVGLNCTTEQVEWLRGDIAKKGLQQQMSVREADFRDVDREYDKVISIGTLEHAGRDQLGEVVAAHAKFLKPGGVGMLHFIGHVGHFDTELFIRKHVFPGGWIPSLADVIVEMERHGLEVVDIENRRRHYALTLDAWAERFDRNWEAINSIDPRRFDERFRRIWRVYLLGCAEMFRSPSGYTHLFQITFSKGNITKENYPMSRAFLYEDDQPGERSASDDRKAA